MERLETYTDVRDTQGSLDKAGLDLTLRADPAGNGPGPSRSSILTGTRC